MSTIKGRYVCHHCKAVSIVCNAEQNSLDVIISQDVQHCCGEKAEFIPLYSIAMESYQEYIIKEDEFSVVD